PPRTGGAGASGTARCTPIRRPATRPWWCSRWRTWNGWRTSSFHRRGIAVPTSGDFDAADDRTLRLAAPEVTVERLDRYLAFQRALSTVPLSAEPEVLAAAHAEAVRTSGLSGREVSELDAVVRDFSGRRAVVQ